MEQKKKLIEVALPLEAINAESAREKSIRHGHPSTLHLWWARRPLATARAVIWSSLVDDPSAHPELFPDEESQRVERERLFDILTRLVKWENSSDSGILAEARNEILRSTEGNPPALLDPFAGGGAIPLEAQRLGLESYAGDLNPVAVTINKSMVEIPFAFANRPPVNPEWRRGIGNQDSTKSKAALGLANDIRYYGGMLKALAYEAIGNLYPKVDIPKTFGSGKATVIAWLWARTVKCPNPACGCIMPLVRSFTISKKKGKEAYVQPHFGENGFTYEVKYGKTKDHGTVNRKGAVCLHCGATVEFPYIRDESCNGRMGSQLIAIAAEGTNGRLYLSPDVTSEQAADVPKPENYPQGELAYYPGHLNTKVYGLTEFHHLFTNRQLTALTVFSSLLSEIKERARHDAVLAGLCDDSVPLRENGTGAFAYAEAISVYLSFLIDKMADRGSAICSWDSSRDGLRNTFGRQAIPMVWDYAESNPFSNSSGCFDNMLDWVVKCVELLPASEKASVHQWDAQSDNGLRDIMISTDPPYYDNIGYADLSDFFYVWMRQALRNVYPDVFRTMLVPKAEELTAIQYRFDGSVERARDFFEDGMFHTCCQINKYAREDIPVTIYYAFKQSESEDTSDEGMTTASTGWETMLSAIIRSGFSITGTWPMRTEMANRSIASGSNALASSIVLVCRKRPEDARSVTRREFINALHREMRPALEKLQSANIAPVDLAQSAIGPGIGVFSRYKSVLEADGKPMSVRAALQIINQELDAFYNEQEGELDRESRFCVDLFNQYAFNTIKFGDADILARAKNTSVQALADRGVLLASKGQVRLLTREEIPERVSATEECVWLLTQQLARAMEKGGVKECASIVMNLYGSNEENAKALAYRLYTICERKNWAQEGYAYNNLVVAWPDIQAMAADMAAATPVQLSLEDVLNSTQQ